MKVFAIGCLVALVAGVLLLGSCGYLFYRSVKNIPEYAQKENLYPKYAAEMTEVETDITHSDSLLQAAAKIEAAAFPREVLWIKLTGTGKNEIQAYRRDKDAWSTGSFTVWNGAGYGDVKSGDGQSHDTVIIEEHQNSRDGTEVTYTMYIEHSAP